MRPGCVLALCALAATAHAQSVPIAIAPFGGRCFDAAQLAARVRARVGDAVAVGAPGRGSHQEVRVVERGGNLSIDVAARDARGRLVGSAHRIVPANDCATALEVATLIIARAALPLNWREAPTHRPPERHDRARPPRSPSPPPPTPVPSTNPLTPTPPTPTPAAPPPTSASAAATAPPTVMPPAPAAAAATPPPRPAPPTVIVRIERTPPPRPEPGTIVLRTRGPDHRWVTELAAAVYGAFPLDGDGADEPAGELSVGFRRARFGAAIRGDVEGSYSVGATSRAGPVALSIRRAALALEAHVELPVRVGALRFVVGPTMPLWSVRPNGLPGAHTSVIVSAAATARVLYHLDLGRVFLTAGVTFDAAFVREQLSLTGVGTVAATPLFEVGPILGFGVNL